MKPLRWTALALAAVVLTPLMLSLGCKGPEKPTEPGYYNGPMKQKGSGAKQGAKGASID